KVVRHRDLNIARREFESVKYPIALGHETAGYVNEVGEGVTGFKKGQPVVVYPARGCGRCWFCLRGEENYCEDGKFIGFDQDGAYVEYLLVEAPRYLFPLAGAEPRRGSPAWLRRDNCLSCCQGRGVACSPRRRLCCRNRHRRTRAYSDSTSQEDEHMLDSSGRR